MDTQDSEDVDTVECKRLKPDKATSPSPSVTSLQSDQSLDRPILFKDGSRSFLPTERIRPDKAASPSPSVTSIQSDQSLDRPILFKDGSQSFLLTERFKPVKAASPSPSVASLQSDQSLDRPILFKDGSQSFLLTERFRQDKAASPSPSVTSLQSDQSLDRPILFKDEAKIKRLKPKTVKSPAPSCTSQQSNQSLDRPILFNKEAQSERIRLHEVPSPSASCTSLQSDQSLDRPILFKDGAGQRILENKRMRPDKAASPAPSAASLKSDQSLDRPILFKDEAQSLPRYESTNKKVEEPFEKHCSLRNKVPSPDISTLSATLLTEDHYRCSVCTKVFKDPVSIPCGHSYCKHCIEIYWSKPTRAVGYACPQCRKRFRDRPVLNVNLALAKLIEELLKAGFSPALPAQSCAKPEDVACDICTEMKLKAVKSCLTCTASYCETHIRQHYTVPALQRHKLVEATISQDSKETMELKVSKMHQVIEEQQEEIRKLKLELSGHSTNFWDKQDEYSCLMKYFYKGLSCNDVPADVTEVVALNRVLELGMLYNCHNDSFISDIYLWDKPIIGNNTVSVPHLKTHLKVLEDNSLQQRGIAFEMSSMLRVKALCGLKGLNGAAAFLNHPIQSLHQDRATLHYKTTTRLDMISQKLLQQGASPSVINETAATHVIIAVCYGAQAFFVFDNERISTERNTEMENVIKKFTTTLTAKDVLSSLTETEKANSILYDCSLYTDVGDWKGPMSFDDAVEIYDSLQALIESTSESAVPLKVWLYPLKKLDNRSLWATLSEHLLQRAENILEHLTKQIGLCIDIITNYNNLGLIIWFPALKEKIQMYSEFLHEYRTAFQRKTSEIIESININEEERENSLLELVNTCDQSPFSTENTQYWLEKMKTELAVINRCREANLTIVTSQDELQCAINYPPLSRVFCFTISSVETEDSFLTILKQYTETVKNSTLTKSDCKLQYSQQLQKPVCISQKVLSELEVFISAKESNEDVKQTKFIAASVCDDFPQYSVQFYDAGKVVSKNLKLQTQTDFAQLSCIKHTSVSLKKIENINTERYLVEFRALSTGKSKNTWKRISFDSESVEGTFVISDLPSGKQFQLRYLDIEQECMSTFSKIIHFQTAVAATPGKPFINELNHDNLRVTWEKAQSEEDCPVLRYMVEYKEAGLEGWSSVLTQGPECECTLTILHSTCYKVRVSAIYEDIVSKPSQEIPVPLEVWRINLSERKSSILLEVLKLQTEKKPVELIDWTDEESEVRGFLQCLPYISELRFVIPQIEAFEPLEKRKILFILNLCLQATLHHTDTLEAVVEKLLLSVSSEKFDVLLDLCSHVKDYESNTGRSVLPALQPVYQSHTPAILTINLSKRKSSILLEVLKLQTEKKPVELIDWTDEESEVNGFLQCLPYISQLRIYKFGFKGGMRKRAQFLLNLTVEASKCVTTTGENYIELLTSVCSYRSFLCLDDDDYPEFQTEYCDFLLDLYSRVKDYESQTGRSVLPALQPVYQSAPRVWRINLSERKSSILLEVLKLQTEKKPVKLIDCSDEESEVRGFLQCLPYISQLSFRSLIGDKKRRSFTFLVNLIVLASDFTTKENYKEILTSVCSYRSFPFTKKYINHYAEQSDFLLDLYSHVKDYESQTGRGVLPALQPVYQSAPAVWRIKLSERKSSILLEVLKLQTEKKPVELIDCTDEESEVRGFLQCLPYISQLGLETRCFYDKRDSAAQCILSLIVAASEFYSDTGENYTKALKRVCSYKCFPNADIYCDYEDAYQCDFLLDLYSHFKDYESQTGRSILPELQPVYQSAPAVWRIKLSERKSSILLEVLKLQKEKKPVELINLTDEESEVRGFLQCLPYITELGIHEFALGLGMKKRAQFLLNLTVEASKCVATTGENYIELLTSVCSYRSFLFLDDADYDYQGFETEHCDFLLDLCSLVKDYESQSGRSVLPALQPVYQSAPAVWSINLSERKSSILLEVLKLQTEKKPVELIDCTDEESEVRGFLQCLPYISELRKADQHFPSLCKMFGPIVKADQVTPLLQALNFTVTLSGKLPSSTCRSVGRVLGLSQSNVNLTLKPRAISLRGLKLLFRPITHLQTLSLEHKILVKMVRALRSFNDHLPLTTEKLSLITKGSKQNSSHILSSLESLLKLMSVQCLDLTRCKADALTLTALLGLQNPLILRLSKETLQKMVSIVYEAQNDELTCFFLKKTSKDLTSCSLTWEMIHYLLQHGALNLKIDLRNSKTTLEYVKELLPVLNKVQLKRLNPSFTLSIITEIYKTRSTQYVSSLMRSAGNYINLNGRVLDSVLCAALRFTLEHCNTLKLNLLWTSIPEEELKSFLPLFNKVTQLSVDRLLLLKLLHCCSSTDVQQEAAAALLSALQNALDFSCGAALDLTDTEENQEHFKLSIEDSLIISSVLQKTLSVVKLILKDCELSDEALKQLWPILPKVQLSCSKALLLQFLACISKDGAESSTVWSAEALSQALGGEMDLSHTQMDQRSCEQLAVFLEYSEGLTELDLSHCKLTDQCMEPLLPHLHKTQTLDLSHNNITDESANKIHSIVSNQSNIQTVRLFGNRINDRKQFIRDKRFEIW